jgi:uncharacterized integral membrane protein
MTTSEQPPYDPSQTTVSRPAGAPLGAGSPTPQHRGRRGPGWGAYVITIIALILLIAVIVFILQNDDRLHIKFFSWDKYNVKSAYALGAAGIVGFLAGIFLGLIPWLSARRKLRSARRSGSIN